jgi:hypothetical protein
MLQPGLIHGVEKRLRLPVRDGRRRLSAFVSTSLEGDQANQGFNFLIPVDTIQGLATQIGVIPQSESPFTQEREQAAIAYLQGRNVEALNHRGSTHGPELQAVPAESGVTTQWSWGSMILWRIAWHETVG